MNVTTYIDLGREGVVSADDIQQASAIQQHSPHNIMQYINKALNVPHTIRSIELGRGSTPNNVVVTIHSNKSLVSQLSRIEEAIIKWFSPSRMGLDNHRLRYFITEDGNRNYISTIKIVLD